MTLLVLTEKNEILKTYAIYKDCMFLPTEEKFSRKVDSFLNDASVKIFACLKDDEVKGITVLSFTEEHKAEILGIAVHPAARKNGIGTFMIDELLHSFGLASVYAETDDDAVGFYRKNHFQVIAFTETYDGEAVTRYHCERKR